MKCPVCEIEVADETFRDHMVIDHPDVMSIAVNIALAEGLKVLLATVDEEKGERNERRNRYAIADLRHDAGTCNRDSR